MFKKLLASAAITAALAATLAPLPATAGIVLHEDVVNPSAWSRLVTALLGRGHWYS